MKYEEITKKILELEELAEKVLALKNRVIPRRPIVIEFCGSPKSGKTSCINSLDLFLRRNHFRTHILTERASVCPVKSKCDPFFNIWTVSSAIAELSEVLSNHSKEYDVIILDRGIFDALCWFSWLLEKKYFDQSGFDSIKSFLLMKKWQAAIDIVYVFTANTAISLNREFANLLTRKTGSIMCENVLSSYLDIIRHTKDKYKEEFKKIEHIDTSDSDQNEVNGQVTHNILQILLDSTSEKIGFLKRSNIFEPKDVVFDLSKLKPEKIEMHFNTRDIVEESSLYVQPLPIVVITNKERTEVLVVRKNKTSTSEESPESQKDLLYLGGHIREEDLRECKNKDIVSVSKYALHRELKEEIGHDYYPSAEDMVMCIWIRDGRRSEKHLALCYVHEVEPETIKVKLDKNEFVVANSSKSGTFQKISKIYESCSKLEKWSQVILEKVFLKDVPKQMTLKLND